MLIDVPYEAIARDAMDGKRVAVFCDSQRQADAHGLRIAAAAKDLGAKSAVCSRRRRVVNIDGNLVHLFLTGGDGRGYSADVVYLSDLARMQHEWGRLMGATIIR